MHLLSLLWLSVFFLFFCVSPQSFLQFMCLFVGCCGCLTSVFSPFFLTLGLSSFFLCFDSFLGFFLCSLFSFSFKAFFYFVFFCFLLSLVASSSLLLAQFPGFFLSFCVHFVLWLCVSFCFGSSPDFLLLFWVFSLYLSYWLFAMTLHLFSLQFLALHLDSSSLLSLFFGSSP